MTRKKIAVLGTGWLGMSLVRHLIDQGFVVNASYRRHASRASLVAAGAEPYLIDLPELSSTLEAFLHQTDVLIITLPPRGRARGDAASAEYLAAFEPLRDLLADVHVVYTSSTGIYGGAARGEVIETTSPEPDTPSGRAVAAAEHWLSAQTKRLAVLRLAGLFGPGRDPADFFRKAESIAQADAPVNLVHRDDVLAAIQLIISTGATGIYHVCADTHPPKGEFYGSLLRAAGVPPKRELPGGANAKQINSLKIRALGWETRYDDLTVYSKSNTGR